MKYLFKLDVIKPIGDTKMLISKNHYEYFEDFKYAF